MSNYISREAAIEAIAALARQKFSLSDNFQPYLEGLKDADIRVRAIPAADVAPVVYCKDCRHRDPEDHKCDCGEMERQGCPFKVADDYFCAYGEARA